MPSAYKRLLTVSNLANCSIIIPVSVDCKERLEHLEFLIGYFERHFTGHQLIIVEQGNTPFISHPSVRFVKNNRRFSLSEICNIGASFVTTPFFCKYDVDAVIHPKALFDAFEQLKGDSETAMVIPYNGISFTVQNPLRKEWIRSLDFRLLPFIDRDKLDSRLDSGMYIKNDNSNGLIHLFRTSYFKMFGGYNEEFIGWGYEDDEIVNRFARLQKPAHYLSGYNAFHLDHPRLSDDPIQAEKNHFLSHVVKNMDREDLLEYIKAWNRFS